MQPALSKLTEFFSWVVADVRLPWLLLLTFAAPLLVLARRRMHPHVPLLILGVAPCLATIGLFFSRDLMVVVALVDIVREEAVPETMISIFQGW